MEEQTRNADSRFKSYIDTIDALNKKESASRALTFRLKKEIEDHFKELSLLRTQLNNRKMELEQESTKSIKLEKDLFEAKTTNQLLRGKLENLEKKFKDEKIRWEEESYNQEVEIKRNDVLSSENDNLRRKIEKAEADMSKMRIEIGRLKEEEKSRNSLMQEVNSNSGGGSKRELLDEIDRRKNELQAAQIELSSKQTKISDLENALEELSTRLRTTEKELLLAKSTSQASMQEPFNSTSPVNLHSSRPSLANYNSQQSSSANLLLAHQKDQEISELKLTITDLKRELEEKTNKMQGLIRFLGDSESGYGEKERRLEKKVEAKEVELNILRREMIEREEEAFRLQSELEERLKALELEKENHQEILMKLQNNVHDSNRKNSELEAENQRLTQEIDAKHTDLAKLVDINATLEQELRLVLSRAETEKKEQDDLINDLRYQVEDLRKNENSVVAKLSEIRGLEEQVEYLNQQNSRSVGSLRRYQEIANQIYCNSIKCDTVYKGGLTIFVKYARAVYIPLVFNYHPTAPVIGEITKESSAETLEAYCQKIRKLQEQVCCVSFVLDMNSVSPKIKKLLEANSMVAVCRVDDVVQEKVDLKTNKELVSFVQAGVVFKVAVEEVVCLMSASFDNAIDLGEFKQMESGAQNKTFQY